MAATPSTSTHNRRWWLWWPLLALLAWLVVQEWGKPGAQEVPSRPSRPTAKGASAVEPLPLVKSNGASLALVPREALLATTGAATPRRDLFAARSWTPPPQAPVVQTPDLPLAPPLPFRYIGKQWDGQAWEVYAVNGDQTYVLREGLVLDEQYKVDRIAPPHVTLTYLPLGTVQNLLMGDTR
ncbi:hypothetical protein [Hydrogenophaga sp.]|uniref:hypothetical protein n=1 Tax=Hydrogenophaga sp. TaxID=1904254 RepID=UPI002FC8EE71